VQMPRLQVSFRPCILVPLYLAGELAGQHPMWQGMWPGNMQVALGFVLFHPAPGGDSAALWGTTWHGMSHLNVDVARPRWFNSSSTGPKRVVYLQAPMVAVGDADPGVVVATLRQALEALSRLSNERAALEEALRVRLCRRRKHADTTVWKIELEVVFFDFPFCASSSVLHILPAVAQQTPWP